MLSGGSKAGLDHWFLSFLFVFLVVALIIPNHSSKIKQHCFEFILLTDATTGHGALQTLAQCFAHGRHGSYQLFLAWWQSKGRGKNDTDTTSMAENLQLSQGRHSGLSKCFL